MNELYIPPERSERNFITGQFFKGCVPHNKGRKMVYHSKRSRVRSIKNLSKGRGAWHKTGAGMNKKSVVLIKDGKTGTVTPVGASAIFIAIGYEPENRMFSPPVRLDKAGYILAGEDCRTGVQGVFAAGDCRTKPLRQIVTATADGAVAAFQAGAYLSAEEEKKG